MAQAIPTYMMSIFRNGSIDESHSIMAKFWWGAKGTKRKLHWHLGFFVSSKVNGRYGVPN